MVLEPKRPPFDETLGTSLLEDMAFEPNRPRDEVLGVGDASLKPGKTPTVDKGSVDSSKLLLEGGWVDTLLPEGAGFEPNELPPETPFSFENNPIVSLLLLEMLLVVEEPKLVKLETTDSFLASLVPVSLLVPAVVATIPFVRGADALAKAIPTASIGCVKGFTGQVCAINSNSPFFLFVSGSR